MAYDELVPFFTHNDLYLKTIHEIDIIVRLPKLRQMGQSVSNWEIRERIKKMLVKIELDDFKVSESTLEQVHFVAVVKFQRDIETVSKTLHGVSFHAIGFTDPLTIHVNARRHSARNSLTETYGDGLSMLDTVYVGGLPFDWFKLSDVASVEDEIVKVFSQFGDVRRVDVPQCHFCRRAMPTDLSGMRQSVWSYGEDTFFEAYVQFRTCTDATKAMSALYGRLLVRKMAGGELRDAKLKLDFDSADHLGDKKIRQRKVWTTRYIAAEKRKQEEEKDEMDGKQPTTSKATTSCNAITGSGGVKPSSSGTREATLMPADLPNTKEPAKDSYEQRLRRKLKAKLMERLHFSKLERETAAKSLLIYIAKLETKSKRFEAQTAPNGNSPSMMCEYAKERGLYDEEHLRMQLLRRLNGNCDG